MEKKYCMQLLEKCMRKFDELSKGTRPLDKKLRLALGWAWLIILPKIFNLIYREREWKNCDWHFWGMQAEKEAGFFFA